MATFNAKFTEGSGMNATFLYEESLNSEFGNTQIIETGDYNALSNKPSIENVVLQGNKTIQQIGVGTATIAEIEKILYLD